MDGNLNLIRFAGLLVCITLGSFGQIFLKMGLSEGKIEKMPTLFQTFMNVLTALTKPLVMLGILFYIVSLFGWLMVISRVRLSVAYPLISISYIMVVILSAFILHEKVDWKFAAAGLACISVGVSFIGFGLGK